MLYNPFRVDFFAEHFPGFHPGLCCGSLSGFLTLKKLHIFGRNTTPSDPERVTHLQPGVQPRDLGKAPTPNPVRVAQSNTSAKIILPKNQNGSSGDSPSHNSPRTPTPGSAEPQIGSQRLRTLYFSLLPQLALTITVALSRALVTVTGVPAFSGASSALRALT